MKNIIKKFFCKKNIVLYCVIAILVVIDLVTKALTSDIDTCIISGVLTFVSQRNTGAAWSMFSDATVILAIISLVFVIAILCLNAFNEKFTKNTLYDFAFVLVTGGAIGNMIDRFFLGYVRDFIKVDFIDFPVFNVADSMLVCGVILFCIYVIFLPDNKNKS